MRDQLHSAAGQTNEKLVRIGYTKTSAPADLIAQGFQAKRQHRKAWERGCPTSYDQWPVEDLSSFGCGGRCFTPPEIRVDTRYTRFCKVLQTGRARAARSVLCSCARSTR